MRPTAPYCSLRFPNDLRVSKLPAPDEPPPLRTPRLKKPDFIKAQLKGRCFSIGLGAAGGGFNTIRLSFFRGKGITIKKQPIGDGRR